MKNYDLIRLINKWKMTVCLKIATNAKYLRPVLPKTLHKFKLASLNK